MHTILIHGIAGHTKRALQEREIDWRQHPMLSPGGNSANWIHSPSRRSSLLPAGHSPEDMRTFLNSRYDPSNVDTRMNPMPPRLSNSWAYPRPPAWQRGGSMDSLTRNVIGAHHLLQEQAAENAENTAESIFKRMPRSAYNNLEQGVRNFERGSRNAVRFHEGLSEAAATPQGQYGLRMLPALAASTAVSPMAAPALFRGVRNNMVDLKNSTFRNRHQLATPMMPSYPGSIAPLDWHPPLTY